MGRGRRPRDAKSYENVWGGNWRGAPVAAWYKGLRAVAEDGGDGQLQNASLLADNLEPSLSLLFFKFDVTPLFIQSSHDCVFVHLCRYLCVYSNECDYCLLKQEI